MSERIYRRPDVEAITGLSRSTIYAMMSEEAFPQPIRLGKRAVGWRGSDLDAWLNSRTQGVAK
jgi:prophage regulatory protein